MKTMELEKERDRTGGVLAMDPKKFMMWFFIVASLMIFASLTSAYLVRRAEGNWLEFEIPSIFTFSTVLIVISSFTMHWAYLSAKSNNFVQLRIAAVVTSVLGIVFLVAQVMGWGALVDAGVYFVGNPSGSFLYVFTLVHGIHILLGLGLVVRTLIAAFRLQVHSERMRLIGICATFWHFLDILWVYLFFFLLTFN